MPQFRLPSKRWILCFALWVSAPGWALESFEEVRRKTPSSEWILYDRNHEKIHESRINSRARQLDWVSLDLISAPLKEAVILSEDQRFWDHHGVDWKALIKASMQNIWSSNPRGASTITMQLASMLDLKLVPKKYRRGYTQKIKQIQVAQEIEKNWTKKQIFEAYLNWVTYRGELRGIAAASYGLFGKAPHGLNLNEALILASLIRSPEAGASKVEQRACDLGKKMDPRFQCRTLQASLVQNMLHPQGIRPQISLAPHVASQVIKSRETQVTLDRQLQTFVLDSLQRQVVSVQDRNVHDASALVVDNRTGEVLAYAGGAGILSTAPYVDGVRALRQAGSTLKPFLYGIALESQYLTLASLLDDSPLDIPIFGALYRPQNYDHEFHGKNVTLRTALASSLNVPAVKTLGLVGVGEFVEKLKLLGFEDLREADYYGPSLALGSADITLWNLVNAYRTLANGGIWSELHLKSDSSSKKRRRAFTPQVAFLISDVLSDRESRHLTFGLENPLSSRFWTAVKTGTSKDMRDNWCVGYSDKYTVGVWVGNFSGEPMWNVTGVTGAAPVWSEIMKWLHQKTTSRSPRPPEGLARVAVGEGESRRREWFLQGTEPPPGERFVRAASESVLPRVRITYPVEGMMIARDPDIPEDVQKVFFESNLKDKSLKWFLNDQEVMGTSTSVSWQPNVGGRYRLALVNSEGQTLDSVNFVVR